MEHHELFNVFALLQKLGGLGGGWRAFKDLPPALPASWLVIILLGSLAAFGTRRLRLIPGPLQNGVEWCYEVLAGFIERMMPHGGRQWTPFLGTLFLYVLVMNVLGVVPGMLSPTANLNMTLALALVVFATTHYAGARAHGALSYIKGIAGEPMWLAPLMLPVHLISELARPVSLSVRLYCNIFGEDQVIVGLVTLGALIFNATHHLLPVPIQLPLVLLAIFTSFVQALVFLMLSASYIEGAIAGGH